VAALQTTALKDLQARSRDVVRLTSYTPKAWQPVWYISYFLFGTAAYADEILDLNPHITHPLLVPPGMALRIMRHD
jgi:prophage DNA circulation protein